MKKKYLGALLLTVLMCAVGYKVYSANTDRWALSGDGAYNNIDVMRLDSTYNFRLSNSSSYDNFVVGATAGSLGEVDIYSGDINLLGTSARPSTTAGTYPGITCSIHNASTTAMSQGMVILAYSSGTVAGYSSFKTILATTSVIGVADGAIAAGAVGKMRVAGYALVLTTGVVNVGDLLVSTGPAGTTAYGTHPAGYAGKATGTVVVGSVIGKALGVGTVSGGLTPVLLANQ